MTYLFVYAFAPEYDGKAIMIIIAAFIIYIILQPVV